MAGHRPSPRFQLRAGVPVLQREPGTVQVGLTGSRVRLPDSPAVRALLEALRDGYGRSQPGPRAPEQPAWARLAEAGLLVPAAARTGPAEGTPVVVVGGGALADGLARLLRTTVDEVDLAVAAHPPGAEQDAGLVVLAADGEVSRRDVDGWVRAGVAHLLVWARERVPQVGPLVVPGTTACLRCLDAHDAEDDPRWPLLVEQAAEQPSAPADPVLAALALAWAVRDVRTLLRGGRPSTWSAVVSVSGDGDPRRRSLRRHPCCGCAWDLDLLAG